MRNKNLPIGKIAIIIGVIVLIIFGIITIIRVNSIEYKLEKVGYLKDDITNVILETLETRDLEFVLENDYNPDLIPLLQETYFIYNNLYDYLEFAGEYDDYKNRTPDLKSTNDENKYEIIVAVVNVGANKEWYSEIHDTDLSKGNLILTNKFHQIPEDYVAGELVDVRNWYAYGNQKTVQEVYDHFLEMWNAADRDGIKLIISSAHRDYNLQRNVYNDYRNSMGQIYADSIAARPGHSEHQTGLAIDITTDVNYNNFDETEAFNWLINNAHKYGFILRYPDGKTYLTGYSYESWHYRYLGIETATKVHDLGITYDEYYAYFEN